MTNCERCKQPTAEYIVGFFQVCSTCDQPATKQAPVKAPWERDYDGEWDLGQTTNPWASKVNLTRLSGLMKKAFPMLGTLPSAAPVYQPTASFQCDGCSQQAIYYVKDVAQGRTCDYCATAQRRPGILRRMVVP